MFNIAAFHVSKYNSIIQLLVVPKSNITYFQEQLCRQTFTQIEECHKTLKNFGLYFSYDAEYKFVCALEVVCSDSDEAACWTVSWCIRVAFLSRLAIRDWGHVCWFEGLRSTHPPPSGFSTWLSLNVQTDGIPPRHIPLHSPVYLCPYINRLKLLCIFF